MAHPVRRSATATIEEPISKKTDLFDTLWLQRVELASSTSESLIQSNAASTHKTSSRPLTDRVAEVLKLTKDDSEWEVLEDDNDYDILPINPPSSPVLEPIQEKPARAIPELSWKTVDGEIKVGDFVVFPQSSVKECKKFIARRHPKGLEAGLETAYKVIQLTIHKN